MDFLNFDFAHFMRQVTVSVIPFMFAITVHEVSHGYAAWMLGDTTAKDAGRLTLNPIAHIDVLGLLFLLVTRMFGWAKPVPVNFNIVGRKKYGPLIVAAAGPVSNFILAIISVMLLVMMTKLSDASFIQNVPQGAHKFVEQSLEFSVQINVVLAIFNLLPVLPLDGGRILHNLLPRELAFQYGKLERWGMIIIIILLFTGLIQPIIWPLMNGTINFLMQPVLGGSIIG